MDKTFTIIYKVDETFSIDVKADNMGDAIEKANNKCSKLLSECVRDSDKYLFYAEDHDGNTLIRAD